MSATADFECRFETVGKLTEKAKREAKKKAKQKAEAAKRAAKKKAQEKARKAKKKIKKKANEKTKEKLGFNIFGSTVSTKLSWGDYDKRREVGYEEPGSDFIYRHDSWYRSDYEVDNGWEVNEYEPDDGIVIEVPSLDPDLDPDL